MKAHNSTPLPDGSRLRLPDIDSVTDSIGGVKLVAVVDHSTCTHKHTHVLFLTIIICISDVLRIEEC